MSDTQNHDQNGEQNNGKAPAQDVLGGPGRRAPRRYNRRLITTVSTVAFMSAAGLMVYGIAHNQSHQLQPAQEQETPDDRTPVDNLSTGYTPNKSDQATGQVKPRTEPAAQAQATGQVTARDGSGDTQQRELSDEEKDLLAANKSGLFFDHASGGGNPPTTTGASFGTASTGQSGPPDSIPHDGQAARQGSAYGDATSGPGVSENGRMAGANNAFLATQGNNQDTYAKPMQAPISPYEVQAGSIIPAALITMSNSDLPGDLIAHVTENVYDSATGRYLLIPQGAKLYGRYANLIAYGQTRSLIVWNRLILPNGNSESLGGMIGTDAQGQSGMTGDVNHHNWSLVGALLFATAMSVGPSLAQSLQSNSGGTLIYSNPAQQAGSNTQMIGQEFLARELARPNTIKVYGGQPLRVLVNKDMVLKPYTP